MLIWKNDTTQLKNFTFPKSFLLEPDETCKANGLMFDYDLTMIGYDYSNYKDFEAPTIKSYLVDITDSITAKSVFKIDSSIPASDAKLAETIKITFLDGTNLFTAPNTKVKIFANLLQEPDSTVAPFEYLLSNQITFYNVKRWLYSIQIQNKSGKTITAVITVSKHKPDDSNYDPPIVIQVAH